MWNGGMGLFGTLGSARRLSEREGQSLAPVARSEEHWLEEHTSELPPAMYVDSTGLCMEPTLNLVLLDSFFLAAAKAQS